MRPLTERIDKARWKMLGHVLRSGYGTPAFQSFRFAITGTGHLKGRVGRHRTNLFDFVIKDLGSRGIMVRNDVEFEDLVHIASDRDAWRNLFSETD